MRAGRMRHSVTLQRQASTQDAWGQQTNTWTDLGTCFASIEPVRGREYFVASGEKANVTHELRMRARSDISPRPDDRVSFGTRNFDIQSVLNLSEHGREWVFMCIEDLHTT